MKSIQPDSLYKIVVVSLLLGIFIPFAGFSQVGVTGKWKTIDDETNKPKSIVEIFEKDGKYFGKIIKLFHEPGADPDPVCDKCDEADDRFKKKIIGMVILQGLSKDGDEFSGGTILDPADGRVYRCKIWLSGNKLMLRGYWGPFYRTQTWKREN